MNRAAANSDSPPTFHRPTFDVHSRLAKVAFPCLLFVACLLLAASIQWVYKDAAHTHDDIYVLLEWGLVLTGKSTILEYGSRPYAGHAIFLWKLIYALEHQIFGLEPRGWHAVLAIIQATSAMLLFWWLRLFSRGTLGPAVGALLWSVVAIGRWDNPLLWLVCGTIPASTLFVQLGMIAAVMHARTGGKRWLGVIAASVLLAVGTWSISWILTLAIAATILVSRFFPWDRPGTGKEVRVGGLAPFLAWLIPFLLLAPVALVNTLPETQANLPGMPVEGVVFAVERTTAQFAVALGNLSFWNADVAGNEQLGWKLGVMAVVSTWVALVSWRRWRDLLLLFGWAGLYLFCVNLSRSTIDMGAATSWGRYFYLTTLPWCAAFGAAIDNVSTSGRRWARLLGRVFCVATLPMLVAHQWGVAEVAIGHFEAIAGPSRVRFLENQRMLLLLEEVGKASHRTVRLPDIPLNLPPVETVLFPLSAFVAVTNPGGLARVEIIAGENYRREEEVEALAILQGIPDPMAKEWADTVTGVASFQRALVWLSDFATRERSVVSLPNLEITMNAVHFPVSQFMAMTFGREALRGLRTVPPTTAIPDEMRRTMGKLRLSSDPMAAQWIPFFENWETAGASGTPKTPDETMRSQP